jgi:hypothetical protein
MPIHDWTKVNAGIFHHFHQDWTIEIARTLNRGLLPANYHALAEQIAGGPIPDVLTLEHTPRPPAGETDTAGGLAVAATPPRTRIVRQAESEQYAGRANRIVIRHSLGYVVAVLEIVSQGNKDSRTALRAFVEKTAGFLRQGVHLLIIDLFPPTSRDPQGIHQVIWDEIHEEPFELPPDKPLTLVAYKAGSVKTAYIEPVAVGDALPNMPIFLTSDIYVLVPLETTYMTTWSLCPQPMKDLLEPNVR